MNKVTRIENGERVTDRDSEITDMLLSGALIGIVGFADLANSHLKIAVFWFWCLALFAGFLQFSLWFSVFVNIRIFLVLPR